MLRKGAGSPPIALPLCAVAGCSELAIAKGKDGTPLCRKHWRQLLRARALMHIAIRAGYERGEKP